MYKRQRLSSACSSCFVLVMGSPLAVKGCFVVFLERMFILGLLGDNMPLTRRVCGLGILYNAYGQKATLDSE